MDSKELGLVAAQQLLQMQDLHYGFWKQGENPRIANFLEAQDKHTQFLFGHIEEAIEADKSRRILDSGCGIGVTTNKLLEMGYRVDGLVPSNWMAQRARTKIEQYKDRTRGEIYECIFEDIPVSKLSEKYSLVFFSESFQYVKLQKAFEIFDQILVDNGKVIIFDFFKKDGVPGRSPLGGGHSIGKFYQNVEQNNYTILNDLDVTENLSPNLKLINDILVERVIPFGNTLDTFLSSRYKFLYKSFKYLIRKKLKKVAYKYSQNRNQENFQKYKTYRLIVLEKN